MQKNLRAQFPFFTANPGLIYLDSAATALKPQVVIDALIKYNTSESVNVHRGVYDLSQRATNTVESVRKKTASFASNAKEATTVFTKGTTEGFNLLAHSLTSQKSRLTELFPAYSNAKPPAIILSDSEHHANIIPWQIAAERAGYKLYFIPVDVHGNLQGSVAWLKEIATTHAVRIISLSLQSNVTGIIHDISLYREFAAAQGAIFIVDAAQAIMHARETIKTLDCDFVLFSAHKIFGSTGLGAIVARKPLFDICDVYQSGGGMISLVEHNKSTYIEGVAKFEAGTQAIGEIYALEQALEFALEYRNAIHDIDADLVEYADEKLQRAGVHIFGLSAQKRSPIYSFEIPGVHAHDTATLLDEQDICVRAGHHCCQLLMRALGVSATVRASFCVYNTRDDVDRLTQAITYIKEIFRK